MRNRYRVRLREPVRRPEAMSTSFALLTSLRMTSGGTGNAQRQAS